MARLKEHIVTDQNPVLLDKNSYQLEVTRPVWRPYNDIAHDLVGALVNHFNYPTSGPKAQKYAVVVASGVITLIRLCDGPMLIVLNTP